MLANTSEVTRLPHLQVLGSSAQEEHMDLILDMLFYETMKRTTEYVVIHTWT